eukprot:scaffold11589_cov117-Cylindrotheca_fusiformis.AAC.6
MDSYNPLTRCTPPKKKLRHSSPFDFEWDSFDRGSNADYIRELKHQEIKNPRQFSLENFFADEKLSDGIIDTFRHFAEREIMWQTLAISLVRPSCKATYDPYQYTRPVLSTANALSLFQRVEITAEYIEMPILSGIALNKRLESLSIHFCSGAMVPGDSHSLKSLLESSSTLKELRLWEMGRFDQDLFRQGLARNKSLQKLNLSFDKCEISDEGISQIISIVADHPKLQSFSVFVRGQFGAFSSKALQKLLISTKSLSHLKLYDRDNDATKKLNLDLVLHGIEKSCTLKKIDFHNVFHGECILSKLFDVLSRSGSSIEDLWFWETTNTKDLKKLEAMDRLHKPIRLYLDQKIIRECCNSLERVFHAHPQLRPFPFFGSKSPSFERISDMNWFGRYLLQNYDSHVPLALWPMVFEKANKNPNVTFEFLKCVPALASRGTYES